MQENIIINSNKNSPDAILSRILRIYGIKEKWGWKSALAARLDTKQPTISGWNSRGVPEAIIAKVSREMNVSINWLEKGSGSMRETAPYQSQPEQAETPQVCETTACPVCQQQTPYITKVTEMMAGMDNETQKDICLSVEKEKLLRDLLRQQAEEKAG